MKKLFSVFLTGTLCAATFTSTHAAEEKKATEKKVKVKRTVTVEETSSAVDPRDSIAEINKVRAARDYGAAGCGLGGMIFGNDDGVGQAFAMTTNGTSGSQTFGISSGTSGCKPDDEITVAKNIEQWLPKFVVANKNQLASDIARGKGETLNSLAFIVQCDRNSSVGPTLQPHYESLFKDGSRSSEELTHEILNIMRNDHELRKSCPALG